MNLSHFRPRICAMLAWALSLIVSVAPIARADSFHKTTDAVGYKCIFNHELLIISHKKTNSAVNVQEANLP
ncbi:MAG: hypothetical protein NTY01_01025 [Verrucomicrobia bacterium]|nr:hypothetical protein [Verrucomicrobiota bacterium]